jgi:hypothetical protein
MTATTLPVFGSIFLISEVRRPTSAARKSGSRMLGPNVETVKSSISNDTANVVARTIAHPDL